MTGQRNTGERGAQGETGMTGMTGPQADVVRFSPGTWIMLIGMTLGPAAAVSSGLFAWVWKTNERLTVVEVTQTGVVQLLAEVRSGNAVTQTLQIELASLKATAASNSERLVNLEADHRNSPAAKSGE